jgi:hypothetical protein
VHDPIVSRLIKALKSTRRRRFALRAVASFCGHRGALVNRLPDFSHSVWVLSPLPHGASLLATIANFDPKQESDELDHFAMRKLRQNFSHSFTPRRPKHFNATSWSMTPRLAIANNANRSTERRPVDWVFDA